MVENWWLFSLFDFANASRLKPGIRLAQAVSQLETDLSSEQKAGLRIQNLQLHFSPPDQSDIMRLTSGIDNTSGLVAGRRCFGPRLTSFLHAVQQFAALGDVILGGSQNLSMATYSSYLDKLSSLFMDIGRSAPRYQIMALLYPQSKRLQASLAEYYIVVVGFCHQIWKFAQKSAITKFVSALSDSDVRTDQSNLESWANTIKEEVNLLMAKKVHDDGHEITGIKALTTWKQTRKLGHCSLYSRCTVYLGWRSRASSSTLIYMGKLGSGKSVLLCNIVHDLSTWVEGKPTPVAYFFCRHDIPESLKARTIFGSLARQLLISIPDLVLSKELPDETTSHLDVEDVCRLLQRVFPENTPAYVVLDGIDECDFTIGDLLVQQLQKLQGTVTLHLCVSVRLDPAKNQSLSLEGLVASRTVFMPDDNPDLEAYIDGENPVIISDIQRKLMKGSQGMFLWVALQLQSLCTMRTDDEILQALDHLPKELPETYTRILQRSGEQGSVVLGNTDWRLSSLINGIISTLASCGGLVVVDEEEKTARLVHHSFKQFLLTGFRDPNDGEFIIDLAHKNVADTIVTYLNYGVFGTQLSTAVAPRMKMGSAPSEIVREAIGSSMGRTIALKLLKSRKMPNFDMGKTTMDTNSRCYTRSLDHFYFYDYAKSFCMQHIICAPKQERSLIKLLLRLLSKNIINANIALEDNRTPLSWAAENGHEAIVKLLLVRDQAFRVIELLEKRRRGGKGPLFF
ncbi:hypothetical protein P152DRAFT_506869 [Eremomyces bilateralis CBS 781.70]|uniref:Nephrocystin 3-like N-terminal domain-containing protein n=1 Tax=Eremomyces bilateralis CBS 781.70 TaxID=1392243 RepID=A0A6G1G574_9PEZI|nr:uncharacterized protein P152DRAFT_506869 [Eremomyces bilateralis CBS 781.70]KAF1813213.1 hypothetical protein P152DRAFT_506869 [Eremomyces bilateralis CBS 781.70]